MAVPFTHSTGYFPTFTDSHTLQHQHSDQQLPQIYSSQDWFNGYGSTFRRDQYPAAATSATAAYFQLPQVTQAIWPVPANPHSNITMANIHGHHFPSMHQNASENLFGIPPAFALKSLHALACKSTLQSKAPKSSQQKEHPFYWRRLHNSAPVEGMTRTKDKYRVVYTEKQRTGLEKTFKEHKFITTKQRAELTKELDLSERQIKIWFQNRRAKDRRVRTKQKNDTNHDVTDATDDQVEEIQEFLPSCRFAGNSDNVNEYSQCRFQGSPPAGTVGMPHNVGPDGLSKHPSSPTEWSTWSSETLMTSLNISPLTTNNDFTMYQRS